jgi:DNA topoisomerase IA
VGSEDFDMLDPFRQHAFHHGPFDWKVLAGVGHVRDLQPKEMGVDLETFEPPYERTERGATVVRRLKTLVKLSESITCPKCKSGQVRKIKDFYG